jgi:hypothetical protein
MYLPQNDEVIVSTTEGYIIHLEMDRFAKIQGYEAEHKPGKTIMLHKSAINTIKIHNEFIVTGGNEGHVKFFDFQFRLQAYFEDIRNGPINSISFANTTNPLEKDKFKCRPFIIATKNAAILKITDQVYNDVTGAHSPEVLMRNHTGSVKAIAVNPNDGRVVT